MLISILKYFDLIKDDSQLNQSILKYPTDLAFSLVAFLATSLYFYQESLIQVTNENRDSNAPASNSQGYRSPADKNLPYFEKDLQTSDGVSINTWVILQEQSANAFTLLFSHENAFNMGWRMDNIQRFYRMGQNVIIYDYRGYGKSTGKPYEAGLKIDAETIWDYIMTELDTINKDKIILFGPSIGGAVSTYIAHQATLRFNADPSKQRLPYGLVLFNTFSSLRNLLKSHDFWLFNKVFWVFSLILLRNTWRSGMQIKSVNKNIRLLIFGSKMDDLVHYSMSIDLQNQANNFRKRCIILKEGNHNNSQFMNKNKIEDEIKSLINDDMKNEIIN